MTANFKNLSRLSVGTIALLSTPAFAQADPDGPPPYDPGEIIVTATKRETTLQDTPMAISVVSGDEIAARGQNSIEDVLKNVGGVQLQNFAQGAQIYIRGIGSSIDPGFADPSVALMVDGIYNGRTESVQSGGYDISRVEVARGPQGTLYGRNANGGVVNVITNDPQTDAMGMGARITAGNYGLVRGEGMVNVPLSEMFAIRLAGFREVRDGYIDDGSNDSDKWGLRGKLLLQPSDALRVVFKAEIYKAREVGQNTVPVPGSGDYPAGSPFNNLGIFPPPFLTSNFNPPLAFATNPPVCPGSPFVGCAPQARFPNGWEQANPGNPWSNNPEHAPGFSNRDSETYSADIQADLGFATLTVLPAYSINKSELASNYLFGTLMGPYTSVPVKTTYKSVEARIASNGDGPLTYVAGVYYLKTKSEGVQVLASNMSLEGNPFTLGNVPQPSETIAGFGQLTYALTDRFRLTGGIRFSQDKIRQEYTFQMPGADQADLQGLTTYGYDNKQSSTLYKAGFEFDVAPQSLLYGHVASGFKQGGVNVTAPPVEFNPEKLTSFELGLKNQFLDNRITLNLAGFYYKYKNYQYSAPLTLPLAGATIGGVAQTYSFFGVVQNAGSTDVYGVEAEGEFRPWRGGRLSASINYLNAKYGQACLGSNPFTDGPGTVPDAGCPAGFVHSLTDKQIQNSPKWSGTAGFSQDFDIGPDTLTFGVNTRWSSSYFVSPEQFLPGAKQKSYTVTNARVRYSVQDDRYAVSLWANNLEKNAQTTGLFPLYRRFVSEPRTYGVTLEISY
ncbi:MAG: TonB-dependent receptor [Sphingomonadaceae bacterium]